MKNLKANLAKAVQEDFQIIKLDEDCGDTKWAVSLYGCNDIAWFLRKEDAERFLRTYNDRDHQTHLDAYDAIYGKPVILGPEHGIFYDDGQDDDT